MRKPCPSGSGATPDKLYAVTWTYLSGRKQPLPLHRLLMDPPAGMVVDHKNGNPLDNRRVNLRLCTPDENSYNKPGKPKAVSRFKGVSYRAARRHWIATIQKDGKAHYLGSSRFEDEAARIYNEAAKRLFGEFAWLNDVAE